SGKIKLRPKIFTKDDIDFLLSGDNLFARKFDDNIDANILDIIETNIFFGGVFRFAKYGLQFRRKKGQSERGRGGRRGLGGGIPPRPSRSEAFPPFGIKPNIKAKQFSIPFKKKLAGGR
ncbi:MAG: hypothetical protein Q8N98_01480, partial [bacterium]|nr:hypothetical protein [bacterium]